MILSLPKLTSYQQEVYDYLSNSYNSGKVACVLSCRQAGKSFTCSVLLLEYAVNKKCTSIYIAPTILNATQVFKKIVKAVQDTPLYKSSNSVLLEIQFTNGSEILFRSTQQGNNLRGLTASGLLILDECAFLKDDDINIILPFTNVHNAPILSVSTPFLKRGYFYELFNSENTDLLKTFNWANHPETERFLTPERKAFYKKKMTTRLYNTEILGNFLDDEGAVFTNINKALLKEQPTFNKLYCGIDFGTGGGDYTAISLLNEKMEQVLIKYINNKTPMEQADWLISIINKYKPVKILAEQNSIGKIYIDYINKKINTRITPFNTSNTSKNNLVNALQLALQRETISLQDDDELITELAAYEQQSTPTGKITFNGRAGIHDDLVMATMLSLEAMSKGDYRIHKRGYTI